MEMQTPDPQGEIGVFARYMEHSDVYFIEASNVSW